MPENMDHQSKPEDKQVTDHKNKKDDKHEGSYNVNATSSTGTRMVGSEGRKGGSPDSYGGN
ncbi:hypothetical protein DNH61_04950 [Paenibacillus sambharensis]|uniref:Uncharacterized protein n=1 Tax=Paenibacillus sambharensis TaxID=1803190 RepID=A0A2W1L9U5_9BACL|nr:hypothetical protein [Paenibacillus sambharensis]PZD96998.1 hypothetical protein DNH61_04950 [Paenibacillus sambharensis]